MKRCSKRSLKMFSKWLLPRDTKKICLRTFWEPKYENSCLSEKIPFEIWMRKCSVWDLRVTWLYLRVTWLWLTVLVQIQFSPLVGYVNYHLKKIMLLTNPLGPFRVDSNSSNNFVLSLSYFFELIVYLVNFEGLLYKCKNFDLAWGET